METNSEEKIKTCPICNSVFTCSPSDCWCSILPPVMPMVENADCYCPACLDAIIKEKTENNIIFQHPV